jgi:hypothetical protein
MNPTDAMIQTVRRLPPLPSLPPLIPLRRLRPRMTDADLAARLGYPPCAERGALEPGRDAAAPLVDLTFGPVPAPQVARDLISGGFWLSWRRENTRIDVQLKDRDELRALIRNALEAGAVSEPATA